MIETACERARSLSYHAVVLCGNLSRYTKLGFAPTFEYGIYHLDDTEHNERYSMVRELYEGALNGVTGTVEII